ncbi:hypothetical protein [Paenibacillus filicis]|uniref:hypothetical protein n=1 Tax=Paenibacillus filicis TaxID=669464 RepID=UPI00311A68EB
MQEASIGGLYEHRHYRRLQSGVSVSTNYVRSAPARGTASRASHRDRMDIIQQPSRAFGIYQQSRVTEAFRCKYGLNPEYQRMIHEAGLRITGEDAHAQPRIIELPEHPFYMGTLFVPQLSSTPEHPHGLVNAFLESMSS